MARISSRLFFVISLLGFMLGCASKAASEAPNMVSPAPASSVSGDESAKDNRSALKVPNRKIIKDGQLRFETFDMKKTRSQIEASVAHLKGYISKESESSYDSYLEQMLVIRVPAEQFDRLVLEISKGVTQFEQRNINASDVTEEYMDIETRIRVKKEVEQRYAELLSKAQTVQEILAIEKQMADLRTEIESIEGRLKFLENEVSFSTLTVTYFKRVSVPVSVGSYLSTGLANGWNGLLWFVIGLVNIWPLLILAAIVVFGIRTIRKRRKARREGNAEKRQDR